METRQQALFIGGTRRIGRELALEGRRRGVDLNLVARSLTSGQDEELWRRADDAPKISGHAVDVATPLGIRNLDHMECREMWRYRHVFWVPGGYVRARLADMTDDDIDRVVATNLTSLMKVARRLLKDRLSWHEPEHASWKHRSRPNLPRPCNLVVMGSISSYKLRPGESAYAGAKAGQAHWLRTVACELVDAAPGSRILLVNCARLGKTAGDTTLDAGGKRIDPAFVSRLVWDALQDKPTGIMNRPFTQINIERTSDRPNITFGPQRPEIP